jgi:hypothetical protein
VRASVALAVLLVSTSAFAQTDPVAAQALFDDAKKLMAAGNAVAACPKLAESERLDPAVGTLLNLAECYVKIDKPSRAWATFLEAEAVSLREGQKSRALYAKQRANELEAKLVRVTVDVPDDARVPALEVLRDGEPLRTPLWGSAVPVDPGAHVIEARASGYKPFTTRIDAMHDPIVVHIVPLEREIPMQPETPEPIPPPPPPIDTTPPLTIEALSSPPPTSGNGQQIAGFVTLGVGGAGIVLGAVMGVLAIDRANAATGAGCDATTCPSTSALGLSSDAKTFAIASDVALAVGASLAVIGLVLVVAAPKSIAARAALRTTMVGVTF